MSLEGGVLFFEDGTEVSGISVDMIKAAPEMLKACRAAFDSIMKHCAETGDVIWIGPPHQLAFVHESVCERLRNVISDATGEVNDQDALRTVPSSRETPMNGD
jgi:hypothetical protein